MAIIYSYPTVTPVKEDLILGTDVGTAGKPTKNFTIDSIIALVTAGSAGLGATIKLTTPLGDAKDPQSNANQPIINLSNISGTGGATFSSYTTIAGASINGQVGNGFTDFTSTRITGTLQTAAQPSVTSLGNLTGLVINGAISGTNVITSTTLAGASNTNIASTLAIKTYVDSNPSGAESLAATLLVGNTTGVRDIIVSAGYDITFTDTSKILMGSTVNGDTSIDHNGTKFTIANTKGNIELSNSAAGGSIKLSTAATATNVELNGVAGVDLKFSGNSKLKVLTGGVDITGNLQATGSGTFVNLLNSGTYQDSSGDVGTSGQLLSSTGTGTNWVTEVPLYTWIVETDSGTGSPYTVASGDTIDFVGVGNISTAWDNTTKEVRISSTNPGGSGAANQVTYWDTGTTITGAAGFTFAGGATGKVTVAGELEAATLSDGTFSGTAGTYTGGVSITSSTFTATNTPIGFIGNASTATALASPGTIQLLSGSGATQGVASNAVTYTSGGDIQLTTTLADTTVTAKALTGLPTFTSSAIDANDTILAALAKLQGQITSTTGLAYEGTWDPGTSATGGGTPDLRLADAKVNGHFYICSAAGSGTPNGDGTTPNSWLTGDWVIYVANGSATDSWQKLDQTNEVLGSGAATKIAKWTSGNTLGTGLISDDGATVTIGTNGNLVVQGDTTLGDNAALDTVTLNGPTTFESTSRFKKGIALGTATDGTEYGATGQVLTASTSAGSPPTWETPTTGTVTSVALTETGDALTITGSPITSSGTINIAGAGAPGDYINGELNLVSFPVVDNYVSWTLAGDTGSSQTISSTNTATFAGGFGISTVASATDTLTTAIDIVGADNAIAGLTAAAPLATDTLWFNDISDSNTIRKATISDIVDLGNETLAEVLGNGNTTGGTDIAVSAGDDITFTSTSKAIFNSALQIINDGSNSYIQDVGTGDLRIDTNAFRLRSANGGETMITAFEDGAVELYHNSIKRFETTTTGVEVVNTDANVPPTILLNQDSNNFTITQAVSGAGQIINSFGSLSLRNDGSINLQNNAGTYTKASFDSSISFSPDNLAETATVPGVTIYKSTDATADGTRTRVYGDLQVDGNIIHEGGGGGIFYGDQAITSGSSALAFTLTRAVTGTLVFDVWLTSGTSNLSSVAKKYTVAHSFNSTPVYNKIIDTGPNNTNDFTVTFANSNTGANGTSVTCSIISNVIAANNIGYTVQVGHESVRALTFTAG